MGLLCIFIVATLTFLLMNLVPGGPFTAEKSMSEAAQRALEAKFGLDKPLGQRYLTYMSDLLKGDMGPSLKQRGRSVNEIISSKFPISARLAGVAVLVSLLVGIPLGCVSAYNRGKFADNIIIVLATCGIAIPSFISSVILLYTFGSKLNILPTIGLNSLASYIMPVTALSIYPTAYITRLMRSSLLDVMESGLYPHREGEGSVELQGSFQARPAKRHSSRCYLCRPHAGGSYDRLVRRGEDIYHSRPRPRFRLGDKPKRLYADNGNYNSSCHPYNCG